jgi:hypothetical protein
MEILAPFGGLGRRGHHRSGTTMSATGILTPRVTHMLAS